jgi:hypothetical protein
MVSFGMPPTDALRSATSINVRVLRIDDKAGMVKAGLVADLIAVEGDPRRLIRVRFIIIRWSNLQDPAPLGLQACAPPVWDGSRAMTTQDGRCSASAIES